MDECRKRFGLSEGVVVGVGVVSPQLDRFLRMHYASGKKDILLAIAYAWYCASMSMNFSSHHAHLPVSVTLSVPEWLWSWAGRSSIDSRNVRHKISKSSAKSRTVFGLVVACSIEHRRRTLRFTRLSGYFYTTAKHTRSSIPIDFPELTPLQSQSSIKLSSLGTAGACCGAVGKLSCP